MTETILTIATALATALGAIGGWVGTKWLLERYFG